MKHSITFGAAVAAVLFLEACSAQERAQPAVENSSPAIQQELTTTLLVSDGGAKAVTVENAVSAPQVDATKVVGKVSRDGAGCVTVIANDGDDWTLLFPAGTTFIGEAVVLPGGPSLAHGDQVTLEGNRVPANEGVSMCLNYARLLSVETAAVGTGG